MNDKKPKQDTTTPALTGLVGPLVDFLMTRVPGSAPCEWTQIARNILALVPSEPGSVSRTLKEREVMAQLLVYAVATAMRELTANIAVNDNKLPEGCDGCSKRANTMKLLGILSQPGAN